MQKNTLFRGRRSLSGLVGLLSLVGCGAESVDLGDNPENLEPATLAGTWVGNGSSEAFLTGSKALRLEIDAAGQGTLLVGTAPLPAPTDPSVGSPPEAQADAGDHSGLELHLYEGATYSTQDVQVSGTSYGFTVDMMQAFEPWCAIQTPVFDAGTQYRCRESRGVQIDRENGKRCLVQDPITGVFEEEEDCLALWLCTVDLSLGCLCTQTGCTAGSNRGPQTVPFTLELEDSGNVLRGGLATTSLPSYVELWRQPVE